MLCCLISNGYFALKKPDWSMTDEESEEDVVKKCSEEIALQLAASQIEAALRDDTFLSVSSNEAGNKVPHSSNGFVEMLSCEESDAGSVVSLEVMSKNHASDDSAEVKSRYLIEFN